MRAGDGLDDRQTQSEPLGLEPRVRVEPLKRLEEPRELRDGDARACVGDDQRRLSCSRVGRDLDPAAGEVVPDRVRDEVRDEPFDEDMVAADHSRLEDDNTLEPAVITSTKRLVRDRGKLEPVTTRDPAAAPGEGEARLEQAFLLEAGVEDVLSNLSPGGSIREGVGERQLEQGTLGR